MDKDMKKSIGLLTAAGNVKWYNCYEKQYQFSSVAQSCPTLCNPMNLSTPGLPVHHQLPEFTQTHVHWAGDAIQPSHPLLSPPPPDLNPYILDQGKLLSKAQRLVAIG